MSLSSALRVRHCSHSADGQRDSLQEIPCHCKRPALGTLPYLRSAPMMRGLLRIAHSAMCALASVALSLPCAPICTQRPAISRLHYMLTAKRQRSACAHTSTCCIRWGMRARLQHVCVIPATWPSIAAQAHSAVQVGHHGVPARRDVLDGTPRVVHLSSTKASEWLPVSPPSECTEFVWRAGGESSKQSAHRMAVRPCAGAAPVAQAERVGAPRGI